jgi:hypothetical protein
LPAIEKYQQGLNYFISEAQEDQSKASIDSMIISNENLFDKLEFDKEVDNFVVNQTEYANGLKKSFINC